MGLAHGPLAHLVSVLIVLGTAGLIVLEAWLLLGATPWHQWATAIKHLWSIF